jgi:hypothetical protein
MFSVIQTNLREIERAEGVRILYAAEAGSRAWGFPSADSDYDVRFLYVHRLEWYLSIEPGRDVIERPIDAELDITGWDLRKALRLFAASNPPLMEWLDSPIVYREEGPTAQRMRELSVTFFAPGRAAHHYYHATARKHYAVYRESEKKGLKNLFYVLRGLLALEWVVRGLGPVPTRFDRLVERLVVDHKIREAIESLRMYKASASEKDPTPKADRVTEWIDYQMVKWESSALPTAGGSGNLADLDMLFVAALMG